MKVKKFISLIISLFILLSVTFISGCDNETYFKPVLRFAIASDVHVKDANSNVEEARLAKMFDMAYTYSKSSVSYNKLDAVIFAGDFTDLGTLNSMQKFKSIVDGKVESETKVIVTLGNHEFYTDASNTEDRYKTVFNTDVDEHLKINGFHFIKLSPNGENFSEDKLAWLETELEKAVNDTPNKPIYVIQHQHVKGTVYGSTGWGVSGLYDILAKYPQVVDFSGHSHFPIQDERSLWQGDFTAIGTGTLSYVEMGLNGVSTDYVFPFSKDGDYKLWQRTGDSDYGVFQILECDSKGNMKILGYDVTSGEQLFERKIDKVTSKSDLILNTQKAETTPVPEFDNGSICSFVIESNGDVLLTVPKATSNAYIESYRAVVYLENAVIGEFYALSGQIFLPTSTTIKIRVTGLEKGKNYLIKTYAVNAYNKLSKTPLELQLTV